MGYTKRLHQLKHGALYHLKIKKILNFLLTTKIRYLLFFRYVKISQSILLHKKRTYPTLTSCSVLPFLSLPMPKSAHV